MEKGEMRVEANISVAPGLQGSTLDQGSSGSNLRLGTKVEVKNLNSFRSVERAIAYEIERQTVLLEAGGAVEQETRGWDEQAQKTYTQRKKESSHDYRYFPDPDLPKLNLAEMPEFAPELLAGSLPELPSARRARYVTVGLKADDADMFVKEQELGDFFDAAIVGSPASRTLIVANYLASDIAGKRESGELPDGWLRNLANAPRLEQLARLIEEGTLSSRGAKETLVLMFADERDPEALAREHGLVQQSDTGALAAVARTVIDANPGVVADYKAGKEAALQFLVGQGMRESKGSANPAALREQIIKLL